MPTAPEILDKGADSEEVDAHASKLVGRLDDAAHAVGQTPCVIDAAARYLAQSILDVRTDFQAHAVAASVEVTEFAAAVEILRQRAHFRAYLWEWIGRGRPRLTQLARPIVSEKDLSLETTPVVGVENVETAEDVRSFVARVRRKSSTAVGQFRTFVNRWTGTRGTTSYYDKDSSPD